MKIDSHVSCNPKHGKQGKRYALICLAFLLLLSATWYFFYYSLLIGHPNGATVAVRCVKTSEYKSKTLSKQEIEHLVYLMSKARPTFWVESAHPSMNTEKVIVSFSYKDGKKKEFSLWGNCAVLYAGTEEDVKLDCMRGDIIHYGGAIDPRFVEYCEACVNAGY